MSQIAGTIIVLIAGQLPLMSKNPVCSDHFAMVKQSHYS